MWLLLFAFERSLGCRCRWVSWWYGGVGWCGLWLAGVEVSEAEAKWPPPADAQLACWRLVVNAARRAATFLLVSLFFSLVSYIFECECFFYFF